MPKETESYPGRDHALDRLAAKSGGHCKLGDAGRLAQTWALDERALGLRKRLGRK